MTPNKTRCSAWQPGSNARPRYFRRSVRPRVVVLSADLDDALVGEGEPLAAGWASHDDWPDSGAIASVGSQTIPVVRALGEVHSCRLASGERKRGCERREL